MCPCHLFPVYFTAVDCGPLTINNGQVSTTSGTTFMMTATYTCNTGYTLIGANTRTCGGDGQWTPVAPMCLRTHIACCISYLAMHVVKMPYQRCFSSCLVYMYLTVHSGGQPPYNYHYKLLQWLVQTSPSQPMEEWCTVTPPSPEMRAPRLPTPVPLATRWLDWWWGRVVSLDGALEMIPSVLVRGMIVFVLT